MEWNGKGADTCYQFLFRATKWSDKKRETQGRSQTVHLPVNFPLGGTERQVEKLQLDKPRRARYTFDRSKADVKSNIGLLLERVTERERRLNNENL